MRQVNLAQSSAEARRIDGLIAYVVSVDTAPVTFQTPSMLFFWGGIGKVELRLVAGEVGSELLARLNVRLRVSSQFRSDALKRNKCQCSFVSYITKLTHPSSRIVPIMTGTALIEPCKRLSDKLFQRTVAIVTHRAIPVDSRLSDVLAINYNVVRNTGAH